jgi:tetratricopeptide (TPR) repeat protein
MPGYAHGKTRITMTSLPPPPAPRGLARLLSKVFGGPVQPLRFFWRIARWLWLAAGLIVIGAGALDYLIELFTGNLPSVAEAFFDSPVLEIASRHPLRFPAAASLVLLLTVLSWGAAREHRRRLNARAERVRQAIRVGMGTNQVDEEMRGALLAGDSYGNFQLATQVHEEDRTTDAVWLYQLILEKEPKHFGANYNLGLIHAEAEHFDAAEGYCRTAILLNSESAEAQGLTAYVLYRLGLLEEAQRRARLAVRMGFSSQLLESLILPGLGVTSSLPATGAGKDMKW